jgi:hypothetical protein
MHLIWLGKASNLSVLANKLNFYYSLMHLFYSN